MPAARMFIAAQLPPGATHELTRMASRLQPVLPALYTSADNYHITLAFLGNTDLALADSLDHLLQNAASGFTAVPYTLGSLGFFGKRENAILWCGLANAQQLHPLAKSIRNSLDDIGVPYDPKPLRAHVTIARKADLSDIDLSSYAPQSLSGKINRVSLYESTRVNGILTYIPLKTIILP